MCQFCFPSTGTSTLINLVSSQSAPSFSSVCIVLTVPALRNILGHPMRYIASFHFITATMMAVGYGDIWARNTAPGSASNYISLRRLTARHFRSTSMLSFGCVWQRPPFARATEFWGSICCPAFGYYVLGRASLLYRAATVRGYSLWFHPVIRTCLRCHEREFHTKKRH